MDSVKLAVNGTLMRGLPLEKNLLDAGAFFLREAATAPCYRLWSINDNNPAMLRVDPADPQAVSVAVEVWQVPAARSARSPSLMVRSFSASSESRSSSAAKRRSPLMAAGAATSPHSDPSGGAPFSAAANFLPDTVRRRSPFGERRLYSIPLLVRLPPLL